MRSRDDKNIMPFLERVAICGDTGHKISGFSLFCPRLSKKVENHAFHLALHYMYYNFVRIHKTLRMSPAMKAGVTDHLWSVEEIAGLLDSK